MSKDSLANSLLLADPSLDDGLFGRTVIHIAEHSAEEGAFGYILNKPTEKTVGEVLQGGEFENLRSIPVYFGGPVGTDQIMFSAYWWDDAGELKFNLRISAKEASKMKGQPGCFLLAHVGHSGWSPGQLEGELEEHSWISLNPPAETFSLGATTLWPTLMGGLSPYHKLVSITPSDLRKN